MFCSLEAVQWVAPSIFELKLGTEKIHSSDPSKALVLGGAGKAKDVSVLTDVVFISMGSRGPPPNSTSVEACR